ncbi:hypothetical protein [Caldimonas brevitalea]|uniref:Uncharacterized protein n=1 Tax=Caldimonas brevitalea TaxID=413882 RepID=A0A0G3BQK9_9BURK|nr:hypothetical protein [Caldimonas brevitalea]AKJ28790.1 hypothetical protein AAW51_2099 [Caldimonas brevitalea]
MNWVMLALSSFLLFATLHMTGVSNWLMEAEIDWPAWTQAVGSVVAIAVAVWLPAADRRRQRREQDEAAYVQRLQSKQRLHSTATELTLLVSNMAAVQGPRTVSGILDTAAITDLRRRLADLEAVAPDPEAEKLIGEMRGVLLQCVALREYPYSAETSQRLQDVDEVAFDISQRAQAALIEAVQERDTIPCPKSGNAS